MEVFWGERGFTILRYDTIRYKCDTVPSIPLSIRCTVYCLACTRLKGDIEYVSIRGGWGQSGHGNINSKKNRQGGVSWTKVLWWSSFPLFSENVWNLDNVLLLSCLMTSRIRFLVQSCHKLCCCEKPNSMLNQSHKTSCHFPPICSHWPLGDPAAVAKTTIWSLTG